MQLKRKLPWLRELPSDTVCSTLKYWAEAYKRHFGGAGKPDWQRKYKDTSQFTVPNKIKVKGQKIYIPQMGGSG